MKSLTDIVAAAILDGLMASDPELHIHEPGARVSSIYLEGSVVMTEVATTILKALAESFNDEAKRYEGAPSGGEQMAALRDMSRMLRAR